MEVHPEQIVRVRPDARRRDLEPGEIGRVVHVARGEVTVDFRSQRRIVPAHDLELFSPRASG